MKTCPNCGELIGDSVDRCFNCNYSFKYKSVIKKEALQECRKQAEKEIEELNRKSKKLWLFKKRKHSKIIRLWYCAVQIERK